MNLTFVQTADPFKYAEMLWVTSGTVRAYAQATGARYEMYLGLKRGSHPWQATFNRVFLLRELIDRKVGGWVCYMDADAWIDDQAFDIAAYLSDKAEYAAIFTSALASDNWWDVNAGVFFLNLDHEIGVGFAEEWLSACDQAWHRVADLPDFPVGGPDDQSVLHEVLAVGDYQKSFLVESPDLINSEWATFIRQHLRSNSSGMRSRLARIKDEVGRVMAAAGDGADLSELGEASRIVEGLYHGIMGRPGDPESKSEYARVVVNRGLQDGVEAVSSYMVNSDEFRSLKR